MSVLLAALPASALGFGLALLWFGAVAPAKAPPKAALASLLGAVYVAACVAALAVRRTFASSPKDGLLIGFFLWLACAAVAGAGRLSGKESGADWRRDAWWALALPLMGAVLAWFHRLPNLLELYYN